MSLLTKAAVTDKGAVLLGRYVACDAHDDSRPLRVVTHAHADHLIGIEKSLRKCEKVVMTTATRDLINVIRSPLLLMGGFVETLDYGKTIQHESERITFFRADHILGAAQVLVEDEEGNRIVYTGDFRIDETPVLDTDVLVIEATYGSPTCKRPFNKDVKNLLIDTVAKGLKHGVVYVFGYHGKLQEVMEILHRANLKVLFIASEKVFQVSKICETHGMRLGRLMHSEEKEGKQLLETNAPCIAFYHMGSKGKIRGGFRVTVSGWEFNSPCREIGDEEFVIALSDHSDFEGLMEYVRKSKPRLVIADNFREGYAETFAREIRNRLGISATALPK